MKSSAYAVPRLRFWHAWSAVDDSKLRGLVKSGTPVGDIAEELGRSVSAIRARAFELGLRVAQARTAD